MTRSAFAAIAVVFRVRLSEPSVQRLADGRHDSLVQVDSRPVRCLRRQDPSEQPLMPRPPKHVGSFARSHANSETSLPKRTVSVCLGPPSCRLCTGAITAGGPSLKIVIQGVRDALAHEHPRLREADVVMLIASKPLDALKYREGFPNPLSRLCGRFSWLAQAHTHAILHVCRKETDAVPLALDLRAQVANLCRQLLVLELLEP